MAHKQYDASLKDVIESHAADWAAWLGASAIKSVRIIDAEVSTVSAAADKAMLIDNGSLKWILHPELLSGRDIAAPRKIWWYNSVFHKRHECLVRSILVLLRPAADGPDVTGNYSLQFPDEAEAYQVTRYRVVRLWELPSRQLLNGGVGILPLATLTDDAANLLPDVVAQIDRRLKTEVPAETADKLRAATTVLMGLRHPRDLIQQVLQGVTNMWEKVYEDSLIYQDTLKRGERIGEERGAITHARKQLLRLGQAKFGPPSPTNVAAIEAIADLDHLDKLSERVLGVNKWEELLAASET